MEPVELLICLVLITVSAFLAGSEIALFTLSKLQLKHLRERFRSISKVIRQLLSDPSGLLLTILICNEGVNIALSTLITSGLAEGEQSGWLSDFRTWVTLYLPPWAADAVVGTAITAPIVLVLGDVTPKVIAARMNMVVAPMVARPMNFVYQMLAPVRWGVQAVMNLFTSMIPRRAPNVRRLIANRLKQEDFLTLVEEAHREGNVRLTELELIRSVFEMDETPVSEITTPLSQVFTLSADLSIEKALAAIRDGNHRQKFSRIPIYKGDRSNIVGVLYSKDLLVAKLEKTDPQTPILNLLWKPFTAHESSRLNSVFRKMKRQRVHMTVVLNDASEAVGVVTMNDILDALLDDLLEEREVHP